MHKEQEDLGDFEEIVDDTQKQEQTVTEAPTRIRVPRGKEIIGTISQRLGGNRMDVQCTDGKTRNCRVPGRFKRTLWLRPKDVVLIEPWEHDNEKGDVIFKYNPGQVFQLRKRGFIKSEIKEF